MDIKELSNTVINGLAEVKENITTSTGAVKTEMLNEVKALEEKYNALAESGKSIEEVKSNLAEMQSHLDKLDVKMQKSSQVTEQKSFNEILTDTVSEHSEAIRDFSNSTEKSLKLNLKAVGDMSYASNFANSSATPLTTEYRQNPLLLADSTVYIRDLLPKGTTNAASIWYPKHTGGEGGADTWSSETKPLIDFDFDAVNAPVQWIAGIVRVPRQMLDDVQFLSSFLQANMLKSLYKAENEQILNGDGTSPNLHGLIPQADAYDGAYTELLEQIIDAAYGQITEAGHSANAVVLNARDAIGIYLNKATGSGEYDVPGGVGFVNGRLTIAGLQVVQVPTAQMASGEFLVGDFNAAQLITRLNPEIRFFEQDEDNVQKNMITIRIEERIALPVYYTDAFVKEAESGI